jgi:hypothetical protein
MKYFIASIAVVLVFAGCFGPKKAKCEVKEVHKLGWWSKNANMKVESFEVKVVESNLNLLNSTAKISYTISGTMKSNAGWEPYIGEVHVSEQYESRDSTSQMAVHTFTPVMHTKRNKKHAGGETKFTFTNEHTVSSYRWGENKFRFMCGDFATEIVLQQKK